MPRILEYTAGDGDRARRVRDVIRQNFGLVSHDISRAKYRTQNGITVNGEPVFVDRILMPGDLVRVVLADEMSSKILPQEGPVEVVYEDEDLICLNKPAGLVVHPSHGHYADSLANYLAGYYSRKGEAHEIRTIGRLDKDTSGLVLFGKNRTAVSKLMDQAERGERKKTYLALACGIFTENEGEVSVPIAREFSGNIMRVAAEDGDAALTYYKILRQYRDFALIEAEIATGRTHQIRVHMQYIGHPLLGDALYGSGPEKGMQRTALHSSRSLFLQPFTGEKICLEAPLPEDMKSCLQEEK